jgi:hypothetical protein
MEPDLEARRIAQLWKFTPSEKECLLDGILGPLRIAQNSVRDRVAAATVDGDQLTEGDLVALAR